MTREEAIEVLAQDLPCETDEDLSEAMTMAIKSLEAWSKVMKEINESFINNDLDFGEETHYNSALVDVLEIIDKHLAEVSE